MLTDLPFVSRVQTIDDLHGPAGRLEALLNTGRPDAPYTAIVCHPHPPSGGTMHNKVVYNAMKVFSSFSLPVLRFNFRGTGLSEGEHDEGHGEVNDVRAALGWLEHNYKLPILFAGSPSAQTWVSAPAAETSASKASSASVFPSAPPDATTPTAFLPKCNVPKLFITGDHDQFAPAT